MIGKYQVQGVLGRGAMGIVYKAIDPEIGRVVAIKTLRKMGVIQGLTPAQTLERFKAEARSAGNLRHPNIITLFEINSVDGVPYIVMDCIDGDGLDSLIQRQGRLAFNDAIHVLSQVAAGLDHAHGKGVIHRDVKPSNIIVDRSGTAFVLDFGVAHIIATDTVKDGPIMGTPGYMAPEQITNQPSDHRVDLFALAVVSFECLTGARPFAGDNFTTVVNNILQGNRTSALALVQDMPDLVETVFARAFQRDPANRYQSAAAFVQALAGALGVSTQSSQLPAVRARKQSDWKPLKGAAHANSGVFKRTRKRTNTGEFLSPWRIGSRSISGQGRGRGEGSKSERLQEVFDRGAPSGSVASMASFSKQRSTTFIYAVLLGGICILLVVMIFVTLSDSGAVKDGDKQGNSTASSLGDIGEDKIELPEVDPVPEGKGVFEMTDREILGALVSRNVSHDMVLMAMKEAESRRVSGLLEATVTALQSDSYLVRIEGLKLLQRLGDRRATPEILSMLDDHDPAVRVQAAKTLAALGDSRSIGYLSARVLRETDPYVTEELEAAVRSMTGQLPE